MGDGRRCRDPPESGRTGARPAGRGRGSTFAAGKGFDPDGLTALRTLISTYPDMGAPGAGEVAASLFMLLGRFVAGGRCDGEAIRVHLQAWRLMLVSGPHPEGGEQLRAGLTAIRDLYEAAEAA